MTKVKSFTVGVCVLDEHCGDGPTHAHVELTHEDAVLIRKMRDCVKKLHVYSMVCFHFGPRYKVPQELWDGEETPILEDWDGRWECTTLHVCDDSFYWKSAIKHTGIYMETDSIGIEEVRYL